MPGETDGLDIGEYYVFYGWCQLPQPPVASLSGILHCGGWGHLKLRICVLYSAWKKIPVISSGSVIMWGGEPHTRKGECMAHRYYQQALLPVMQRNKGMHAGYVTASLTQALISMYAWIHQCGRSGGLYPSWAWANSLFAGIIDPGDELGIYDTGFAGKGQWSYSLCFS